MSSLNHTFTRTLDTALTMPAAPLDALRLCASPDCLRAALILLCSQHGEVRRLDILPARQVGRRQVLCFLRMQTLEQEVGLMQALGIGRFGGGLVLVVDLASPSHQPDLVGGATVSVSVYPARTHEVSDPEGTASEVWSSTSPDRLESPASWHAH